MSDCDFTTLPTETCSHCSGAELDIEIFEPELEILTVQERMEEQDEYEELGKAVGAVYKQEHPGRWAEARDVYGGSDAFVDGLRLEIE